MAHISSRSGIRWGIRADSDSETEAVPFAEPTETIVVTSPEGRFVDVRVLRNVEVLQDGIFFSFFSFPFFSSRLISQCLRNEMKLRDGTKKKKEHYHPRL